MQAEGEEGEEERAEDIKFMAGIQVLQVDKRKPYAG